MKPLIYGSLCSGIEAATVAWHPLGWRPAFFSEIDKHPCAVLKHHYPNVPNYGDMTKFKEWPDHAIDLLVGGTPCQSFSVAGLRKGLADPRGNLALTFLAIADRYRPEWIVWENVPGVLSSEGGRDFGTFLGGLAELRYGFAYRVLDAEYIRVESHPRAVPQRRRRVIVVGHSGDWRRAAAVLFERESLSGHPAPRRKAGQGIARGIEIGPSGGGFTDVNPTLDARARDGPIRNQLAGAVMCLNAGAMGRQDAESETLIPTTGGSFDVARTLKGEGFDASEDGTGRGTPIVPFAIQGAAARENPSSRPGGVGVRQDGAAYTLEARQEVQAVAFDMRGREGGAQFEGPHDTASIRASSGGLSRSYVAEVAFDTSVETFNSDGITHKGLDNASTQETNAGTLLSRVRIEIGEEIFAQWGLGILNSLQSPEILQSALHGIELRPATFSKSWMVCCTLAGPENCSDGALQSLREAQGKGRSPQRLELPEQFTRELGAYLSGLSQPGAQAERFMLDLWRASEGLGLLRQTLSAVQKIRRSANDKGESALSTFLVRRLTTTECEFLQGFPRGYLDCLKSDGPKYKALGNSFAVNVMRWLGDRIEMVRSL